MNAERTVGAALCGRPFVCILIVEFQAGAATEGRPYSTFAGYTYSWRVRHVFE